MQWVSVLTSRVLPGVQKAHNDETPTCGWKGQKWRHHVQRQTSHRTNYRKQWLVANGTVRVLWVLCPAIKQDRSMSVCLSVSDVPPTGSSNVRGSTTENTWLRSSNFTSSPCVRTETQKVTLRSTLVAKLGDVTLQRVITAVFDVLANSLLTGVYHSTLRASNYAVQKKCLLITSV